MSLLLTRYPRALRVLVPSTVMLVAGYSIIWPLTTVYVHDALGRSMTTAGIILMLQSAANLLGNLIGGSLFDAFGGRRTFLLGVAFSLAAALLLIVRHGFDAYLVLMITLGLGIGLVYPCIYAYAAIVWPAGGRRAFNAIYVAQNVGVAAGSLLGGLLAQIRFTLSFAATALLFFLLLLTAIWGFRGEAWHATPGPRTSQPTHKPRAPILAPLLLAGGLFLDWTAYVQWQTTIPADMLRLGIPLSRYSLLWTINGGLILLGQPLSGWIASRAPDIQRQVLLGNGLFIAAFVLLTRTFDYAGFVAAMALSTVGEMIVWPAVPAAADMLAPGNRRGLFQGMISGAASSGRMIGPLLGGFLYDRMQPQLLFGTMAGLFVLGLLVFLAYGARPAGSLAPRGT